MILMQQYALMLHYTLTGEKLFSSDISNHSSALPGAEKAQPKKTATESGSPSRDSCAWSERAT